ncbi:MAG: HD domain-containing protein [Bdellovibrionales bacterium]|nr:HD domain-containing protein [Bdellovibrionales bacterium]
MSDSEYIKIRMASIHPSVAVPFDIFVYINNRYVHYLRTGDHLSADKIENFEKKAPDSFFIRHADRAAYKKFIHQTLNSGKLDPKEKAMILRESSFSLVEELFESPDVARALQESREIIDQFVGFMNEEPDSMAYLIGLSSHDFYTYTHSLDVSIYSLGLGQVAGYSGEQLKELGLGALFHDIGKRHVSIDIITKSGPLDDNEWAAMQRHPTYGLKILTEHNATESVRACCFEHHESFLGNGYPQQLQGNEIHPMARIVAITDTYDALTTKRSYNQPMTPTDALEFMKGKLAGRYDQDLMNAMYSILFKMNPNLATQ